MQHEGDNDVFRRNAPDWAALGVHPSELLGDEALDAAFPMFSNVRWSRLPHLLTWLTVCVLDDIPTDDRERVSAAAWWDAVGNQIVGAALHDGAQDFGVTMRSWGVIFEVAFANDDLAERFRESASMRAAIEQLGPLRLEVTSGRGGGTSGARLTRRPRPLLGSGAASLPLPEPEWEFAMSRPCFVA